MKTVLACIIIIRAVVGVVVYGEIGYNQVVLKSNTNSSWYDIGNGKEFFCGVRCMPIVKRITIGVE
jgi:hypothetical protein